MKKRSIHPFILNSLLHNTYFLVWTTTPWTLPANLAICVNPDFDYVYVLKDGETYILSENLMEDVLGKQIKIHRTKIPAENEDEEDQIIEEKEVMYEVIKTVKGSDLVGLSYDYILADEIPNSSVKTRFIQFWPVTM